MPSNQVNDLITDQEMTFARLILDGAMTDRQAAESAGLNPDTASYTKAKPRVREYMLEHRAAVQKLIMEQEAQDLQQRNTRRERVLARLWELASLSHEMTRNSITSQTKAMCMIVAIEGHIPDRRPSKPEPAPKADTYRASSLPDQQQEAAASHPTNPHPATDPDLDAIASLLAPHINPWEKGPAPSYTSVFASEVGPEVRFSISQKAAGRRC